MLSFNFEFNGDVWLTSLPLHYLFPYYKRPVEIYKTPETPPKKWTVFIIYNFMLESTA